MKRKIIVSLILGAALSLPTFAHDLFLKLDSFFVAVNSKVTINILNGTFMASEGAVNYARLRDVSIVAPDGGRTKPVEANFTKNETTSFLNLDVRNAGTYVVGLSTMEREIDLEGKDFNDYLSHDGIPDTLAERKEKKELDKKVRERYSKHVKAIFQAGDVIQARQPPFDIGFGTVEKGHATAIQHVAAYVAALGQGIGAGHHEGGTVGHDHQVEGPGIGAVQHIAREHLPGNKKGQRDDQPGECLADPAAYPVDKK